MASRSHSLWFNTYGLGPVFNSCGRSYPTTFLGTFGWADALPSVIFPLLSLIGVFWAPPLSGGRAWMPKLSKKRWRNKMIYTSKVGSDADVRWSKQTPPWSRARGWAETENCTNSNSGCWDSWFTQTHCCCASEHKSTLTTAQDLRICSGIFSQGPVSFSEGKAAGICPGVASIVQSDGKSWEEWKDLSLHISCVKHGEFRSQPFAVIIQHFIAAFATVWDLGDAAAEMSHPFSMRLFWFCGTLSFEQWDLALIAFPSQIMTGLKLAKY